MNVKNNKGITLIILVVTIIVMIVLAGIFVSNTLSNDIIKKAEDAVELNNDLINKTKENEKNLLVQDTVEFKVQSTTN